MERKCFWNIYFLLFIILLSDAMYTTIAGPSTPSDGMLLLSEEPERASTSSVEPPEEAFPPSPEGTFPPSGEPDPDYDSSPSPAAEPPEGLVFPSEEPEPPAPSAEPPEGDVIPNAYQEDASKLRRPFMNKMMNK